MGYSPDTTLYDVLFNTESLRKFPWPDPGGVDKRQHQGDEGDGPRHYHGQPGVLIDEIEKLRVHCAPVNERFRRLS